MYDMTIPTAEEGTVRQLVSIYTLSFVEDKRPTHFPWYKEMVKVEQPHSPIHGEAQPT